MYNELSVVRNQYSVLLDGDSAVLYAVNVFPSAVVESKRLSACYGCCKGFWISFVHTS
jgi:hypothetical protein